jgi:hypothetical protein
VRFPFFSSKKKIMEQTKQNIMQTSPKEYTVHDIYRRITELRELNKLLQASKLRHRGEQVLHLDTDIYHAFDTMSGEALPASRHGSRGVKLTFSTHKIGEDKQKAGTEILPGLEFQNLEVSNVDHKTKVLLKKHDIEDKMKEAMRDLGRKMRHLNYSVSDRRVRWGFQGEQFKEVIQRKKSKKGQSIHVIETIPEGTAIPFLGSIQLISTYKPEGKDNDYNYSLREKNLVIVATPEEEEKVAWEDAFIGSRANEPSMDPMNKVLFICRYLPYEIVDQVDWLKSNNYHHWLANTINGWYKVLPNMFQGSQNKGNTFLFDTTGEAVKRISQEERAGFIFKQFHLPKNRVLYIIQLILWCFEINHDNLNLRSAGGASRLDLPKDIKSVKNDYLKKLDNIFDSWRGHKEDMSGNFSNKFVTSLYQFVTRSCLLNDKKRKKEHSGPIWTRDHTWPEPHHQRVLKGVSRVSRKVGENMIVTQELRGDGYYYVGEKEPCVVFAKEEQIVSEKPKTNVVEWVKRNPNKFFVASRRGTRNLRAYDVLVEATFNNTTQVPERFKQKEIGKFYIVVKTRKERVGVFDEEQGVVVPEMTLKSLSSLDPGKHYLYGFAEENAKLWRSNAFFVESCDEMEIEESTAPRNYNPCFKGPGSKEQHKALLYIVTTCELRPGDTIELDYGYGGWYSRKVDVFMNTLEQNEGDKYKALKAWEHEQNIRIATLPVSQREQFTEKLKEMDLLQQFQDTHPEWIPTIKCMHSSDFITKWWHYEEEEYLKKHVWPDTLVKW